MDKQRPLYEELIAVESIPPMPATAARLLALAADPDVAIDRLAEVIERDPPLSARLLGIANSAFYAPRHPVMTIKVAIIRVLGITMVRNMAFGMALSGGLSTANCSRFDLTSYWVMALGTADLASGLARAAKVEGMPDPDTAYLAGLLHNLGELLLVHVRPHDMNEALRRFAEDPSIPLEQHERDVMGMDLWGAGAFLARHWQLPPVIATTIEQLGRPTSEQTGGPLVPLLNSARQWLAHTIAGGFDPLQVVGVDDAYCEYRSAGFHERYDDLRILAKSMH